MKDEPIDRHALSKALKRNTIDGLLFGMPPFTPHFDELQQLY